jgi:hypothetical protein
LDVTDDRRQDAPDNFALGRPVDSDLSAQTLDERESATGHRLVALQRPHGRDRAPVLDLDPDRWRVQVQPQHDARARVQHSIGHQLANGELGVSDDLRRQIAAQVLGDERARERNGVRVARQQQFVLHGVNCRRLRVHSREEHSSLRLAPGGLRTVTSVG